MLFWMSVVILVLIHTKAWCVTLFAKCLSSEQAVEYKNIYAIKCCILYIKYLLHCIFLSTEEGEVKLLYVDLEVLLYASTLMNVCDNRHSQDHSQSHRMWPYTQQKLHQVNSLTEGLLSQKFKSKSETVSKRRQSSVTHKRSSSSNLPVLAGKSYKKPGLEPDPSRPRSSVPMSKYKLLVCDIMQTDTPTVTSVPLHIALYMNQSECW
jgi:hypothetical protein